MNWSRVARRIRVPLGFIFAALFLWLAHPTWTSIIVGAVVALGGVWLRAAASGHVRKNAELTTTGPYAYTRNPLYLGSILIACGFSIASRSWIVVLICVVLFTAIYLPVIRSEEQFFVRNFWASTSTVSASLACSRDCDPHLERHGAAFREHYIYSIASTMLPWAPPLCWERWWSSCCGYNAKSQERNALPPSENHAFILITLLSAATLAAQHNDARATPPDSGSAVQIQPPPANYAFPYNETYVYSADWRIWTGGTVA